MSDNLAAEAVSNVQSQWHNPSFKHSLVPGVFSEILRPAIPPSVICVTDLRVTGLGMMQGGVFGGGIASQMMGGNRALQPTPFVQEGRQEVQRS